MTIPVPNLPLGLGLIVICQYIVGDVPIQITSIYSGQILAFVKAFWPKFTTHSQLIHIVLYEQKLLPNAVKSVQLSFLSLLNLTKLMREQ